MLLTMKRAEWSGAHLTEVEDVRGDTVLRTNEREQFVKSYSFWRDGSLKWVFLMEVLIHLPHPILWMASKDSTTRPKNITFKLLQVFMFLRLYLAPGILHLTSQAYIKRFEIVTHHADLRSVGYKIRQALTLKILFYQHTGAFVLAGFLGLIFIFGFAIFTMERTEGRVDLSSDDGTFSSFWNCLWFSYVTGTTVGYGEYAPVRFLGRVVAAVCAVFGVTLFTVFSGVLVSRVSLSKEQKHGVEFIATRRGDTRYQEAARRLRMVFLTDVCLPVWDRRWDNSEVYMTQHKGNRLHQAVTGLRAARRELNGAFMEADDTVVNEKIEALEELTNAIDREVAAQHEALLSFDEETQQRIRKIIQRVSHYKR
uniref:Potassium channel domain-containing protein n=1 Tax=Neobodo designis TaxID=312471 RepID=A0A7S1R375_NEODS